MLGDLPVALLPASALWAMSEMPEHRRAGFSDAPSLPDGPVVKLFISRKWRDPHHPDGDGRDWLEIREFLKSSIVAALRVCYLLRRVGIEEQAIASCDSDSKWELPECSGTLDSKLGRDILSIVIFCMSKTDETSSPDLIDAVASRVFLWIDFVCLPQSVTEERSEEDYAFFKRSLQEMGNIQSSMHSLVVNTDADYFERAWCCAEFLNTFDVYSSTAEVQSPSRLDDCLRAMVGTDATSPDDVIRKLGLKITNDSDSEVVCRIMWPRVCRRLETSPPMIDDFFGWEVCSGPVNAVACYLGGASLPVFFDFEETWLRRRHLLTSSVGVGAGAPTIFFLTDTRVVTGPQVELAGMFQAIAKVLALSNFGGECKIVLGQFPTGSRSVQMVLGFPTSKYAKIAHYIVNHSKDIVERCGCLHHLPGSPIPGEVTRDSMNNRIVED